MLVRFAGIRWDSGGFDGILVDVHAIRKHVDVMCVDLRA